MMLPAQKGILSAVYFYIAHGDFSAAKEYKNYDHPEAFQISGDHSLTTMEHIQQYRNKCLLDIGRSGTAPVPPTDNAEDMMMEDDDGLMLEDGQSASFSDPSASIPDTGSSCLRLAVNKEDYLDLATALYKKVESTMTTLREGEQVTLRKHVSTSRSCLLV